VSDSKINSCQSEWLLSCLSNNKNTFFGKQYNFSSINNIRQYQSQVPLHYYDDLKPWIHDIAKGGADILFKGSPIAFEKTSGSTGNSKLIPYSQESIKDFQNAVLPWLLNIKTKYGLDKGYAYWSLSPVTRSQNNEDLSVPLGLSDFEYLGENVSDYYSLLPAVPDWVGQIESVEDWRTYTLYWLLLREDLVFISVWSPTFFSELINNIEPCFLKLIKLLSIGGVYKNHKLESDYNALVRLKLYMGNKDTKILWPDLALVSCWESASSASYCKQLQENLYYASFEAKGLMLTEAVITVPNYNGQSTLACNSGFYEFYKNGIAYLANELIIDECYEVIITTSGGLYRYRTNDIVICDGYENDLPILQFMGRGGIQSDLVGEKLTEEFVGNCLSSISGFSMLIPNENNKPHYNLLIDSINYTEYSKLERKIDEKLENNPHYAYAKKIGQLDNLKIYPVEQVLEKYINCMLSKDMRMGDIKIPALSTDTSWLSSINGRMQ
jgi:hypothetical protein